MTSKNSLILYSGGIDSTVLLHEYKDYIALALIFDYGSKHNAQEIMMAQENCRRLKIEYKIIELDFIRKHFKSSLLKGQVSVPTDEIESEAHKSTVVPFRNGIFISIATGIAETENLKRVLIGTHYSHNTNYPDTTEDFIDEMQSAMIQGTDTCPKLDAPYCTNEKYEVIATGKLLGVDFTKTWSCYSGKWKDKNLIHCGQCSACRKRRQALGEHDQTEYATLETA